MKDESLVILFKPFIVRLREPVLVPRLIQQIFDLSIELRIIDGNKLDGIRMKTKETPVACRVVKHFLIIAGSCKRGRMREVLRTACIWQTETDHFARYQIFECIQFPTAHPFKLVEIDQHGLRYFG